MRLILLSLFILSLVSTFIPAFGDSLKYAKSQDFPYMIRVDYGENNCSGSIISPRLILTAAHCINNIAINNILITDNDFNYSRKVLAGFYLYRVTFQLFKMKNATKDLALLYLDKPMKLKKSFTFPRLLLDKNKLDKSKNSLILLGFASSTNFHLGISSPIQDYKVKKNYVLFPLNARDLGGSSGGPTIIKQAKFDLIAGVNSLFNPLTKKFRASRNQTFFELCQFLVEMDMNNYPEQKIIETLKNIAKNYKYKLLKY